MKGSNLKPKRKHSSILLLAAAVCLAFLLVGCGNAAINDRTGSIAFLVGVVVYWLFGMVSSLAGLEKLERQSRAWYLHLIQPVLAVLLLPSIILTLWLDFVYTTIILVVVAFVNHSVMLIYSSNSGDNKDFEVGISLSIFAGILTLLLVGGFLYVKSWWLTPGAGDRCMSDADCVSGMVCNQGFQPPECQQPGDVGYVCAESADCRPELRCYIPKSACARPDDL